MDALKAIFKAFPGSVVSLASSSKVEELASYTGNCYRYVCPKCKQVNYFKHLVVEPVDLDCYGKCEARLKFSYSKNLKTEAEGSGQEVKYRIYYMDDTGKYHFISTEHIDV